MITDHTVTIYNPEQRRTTSQCTKCQKEQK
jgi:hypothetical protein